MLNKHPVAGNTIKNLTKDQAMQFNNAPEFNVEMENGNVGMLLAVKAFVQLFFNPIVGNLSGRFGYKNLIFFGTINLLLSSLSILAVKVSVESRSKPTSFSFHHRRIVHDVASRKSS
jgi:MFS family permease